MANENIGVIDCPFCMGKAFVRENQKAKKYIFCNEDGIIQPTKPNFQKFIAEHATMYTAATQEEVEEPEQEAVEVPDTVEIVEQGDDFNRWIEG